MNVSEALELLSGCDWLKITENHVSASRWKTREQMAMLPRADLNRPNAIYAANVSTRRKKHESFEALLIRAAEMVRSGHVPVSRVPQRKPKEQCACGSATTDLVWAYQLKQRVCRKCAAAWDSAAKNNDMRPTNTEGVM